MKDIPLSYRYSEDFPPDFDMIDTPHDAMHFEPFDTALLLFNQKLTPTYLNNDRSAMKKQYYHTTITNLFIAAGTIAVIAITLQLINKSLDLRPIFNLPSMAVEIIVTLFALVAVISGIISRFHRQWLLDRHKAERIRFLKFRFLLRPSLWNNDETSLIDTRRDLDTALKEIERIKYRDIEHWLTESIIPEPLQTIRYHGENEKVRAFVNYYRKKRIEYQINYYYKKIKNLGDLNDKTIKIPVILFFLGVVAILGHFLIDLLYETSEMLWVFSVILSGCAIILPFLGVAVRSFRLSIEVSRGGILFKEKYTALASMDLQLLQLCDEIEGNFDGILNTIQKCEEFLETEHREWLLLIKNSDYLL